MDTDNKIKDSIIIRAERLLYYNNLLIEQCDNWIAAEERNKNEELRMKNFLNRNSSIVIRNLSIFH